MIERAKSIRAPAATSFMLFTPRLIVDYFQSTMCSYKTETLESECKRMDSMKMEVLEERECSLQNPPRQLSPDI